MRREVILMQRNRFVYVFRAFQVCHNSPAVPYDLQHARIWACSSSG